MGRQRLVHRLEPTPFPEDFPERLERFRMAAGLSRRELARLLCADIRMVRRWNRGTRPDSANLLALFSLAAGMGLLHLLLPEAGEPEPAEREDGTVGPG